MTLNPTCVGASEPVRKAAGIMKSEDVGAVPVVDDHTSKKLIGIVTDRDIVLNIVAEGKGTDIAVEQVMTRNPITCRPDDSIQNAMDRMSQHQVRRIPVVDGKSAVVGIISQADLALRADQPQKVADVVEDISQPVG
jgi:CBS domain-containing protein